MFFLANLEYWPHRYCMSNWATVHHAIKVYVSWLDFITKAVVCDSLHYLTELSNYRYMEVLIHPTINWHSMIGTSSTHYYHVLTNETTYGKLQILASYLLVPAWKLLIAAGMWKTWSRITALLFCFSEYAYVCLHSIFMYSYLVTSAVTKNV